MSSTSYELQLQTLKEKVICIQSNCLIQRGSGYKQVLLSLGTESPMEINEIQSKSYQQQSSPTKALRYSFQKRLRIVDKWRLTSHNKSVSESTI